MSATFVAVNFMVLFDHDDGFTEFFNLGFYKDKLEIFEYFLLSEEPLFEFHTDRTFLDRKLYVCTSFKRKEGKFVNHLKAKSIKSDNPLVKIELVDDIVIPPEVMFEFQNKCSELAEDYLDLGPYKREQKVL